MLITTQHDWLSTSRLLITNVYCFFLLNSSWIFSLHFLVLFYVIFGLHYHHSLCPSTPTASLVTLICTHLLLSAFGSLWQRCGSIVASCRVNELMAAILVSTASCSWEPHEQYEKAKRYDEDKLPGRLVPNMLPEKSREIAPEGMKRLSQSRNNAQLWMCLMVKVKSNKYCIYIWFNPLTSIRYGYYWYYYSLHTESSCFLVALMSLGVIFPHPAKNQFFLHLSQISRGENLMGPN